MKRILFALLIFTGAMAHAQTKATKAFGVGLELGAPTNSIYTIGFGGSGKAEVPLADALSFTVTAGYTSFYYKSALIGSSTSPDPAGYLPLKGGIKYFFSEGVYAEGEAGNVFETNYGKGNMFVFAIGPGFTIPTGKHAGVDVGFRYENWGGGRLKQTGIKVAYRFGG